MERKKHCLITGGSRGIGAATAYRFAQAGYKVTFFYRSDDESAQYTRQKIMNLTYDCLAYRVDVRDLDAVEAAVHRHGRGGERDAGTGPHRSGAGQLRAAGDGVHGGRVQRLQEADEDHVRRRGGVHTGLQRRDAA